MFNKAMNSKIILVSMSSTCLNGFNQNWVIDATWDLYLLMRLKITY